MSDEPKRLWYSVGRSFTGKVKQVSVSMCSDQLFFSTDLARQFALDIIIQCDRIEKEETWNALKNTDTENNA